MSGTISFTPYAVSTPQNSFLLETQGYYQGTALDDPSSRMWLMGGNLDAAETLTMWGGVPIQERINIMGANAEGVGPAVARSTSQANTTGISVFDQAGSMVITPSSRVPQAAIRNYVSFYRSGSNARIVMAVDPALVAALTSTTDINAEALYWDVTNYRVTLVTTGGNFALPTSMKLLSVQTNSQVITYANSTPSWATGDAAVLLI
jgi:hypothetical protein